MGSYLQLSELKKVKGFSFPFQNIGMFYFPISKSWRVFFSHLRKLMCSQPYLRYLRGCHSHPNKLRGHVSSLSILGGTFSHSRKWEVGSRSFPSQKVDTVLLLHKFVGFSFASKKVGIISFSSEEFYGFSYSSGNIGCFSLISELCPVLIAFSERCPVRILISKRCWPVLLLITERCWPVLILTSECCWPVFILISELRSEMVMRTGHCWPVLILI